MARTRTQWLYLLNGISFCSVLIYMGPALSLSRADELFFQAHFCLLSRSPSHFRYQDQPTHSERLTYGVYMVDIYGGCKGGSKGWWRKGGFANPIILRCS
jgi:hypothetical protein